MSADDQRIKGVVNMVGLERDDDQFRSFNIKIGVVVKAGKTLTYEQGEKLMKLYRKNLLGKIVEIAEVVIPCPICKKTFKTEPGMKRHMRMIHEKTKKKKKEKSFKKKIF